MAVSEMQPPVPESCVCCALCWALWKEDERGIYSILKAEEYWKPQFFISSEQFYSIHFIFVHFMRQPL